MKQAGLYTVTIGDIFYRSIYNSPKESELLFFSFSKFMQGCMRYSKGSPTCPLSSLRETPYSKTFFLQNQKRKHETVTVEP